MISKEQIAEWKREAQPLVSQNRVYTHSHDQRILELIDAYEKQTQVILSLENRLSSHEASLNARAIALEICKESNEKQSQALSVAKEALEFIRLDSGTAIANSSYPFDYKLKRIFQAATEALAKIKNLESGEE